MIEPTIPFLVDSPAMKEETAVKQARSPFEHMLAGKATKLFELQVATLSEQIRARISDIASAIGSIDLSSQAFDIDGVSFTLSVTASGKVAILSTVEGSVSPTAGIQVTLKPRKATAPDVKE